MGFSNAFYHYNIRFVYLSITDYVLNPFLTNVSFLYPLKTLENHRFSDVFRGYKSGTLVENGLIAC